MSGQRYKDEKIQLGSQCLAHECVEAQAAFSAYLDGALSGVEMGRAADHLDGCATCAPEFEAWRMMRAALGAMGPARARERLPQRLRTALDWEREHGTHLSPPRRVALIWRTSV